MKPSDPNPYQDKSNPYNDPSTPEYKAFRARRNEEKAERARRLFNNPNIGTSGSSAASSPSSSSSGGSESSSGSSIGGGSSGSSDYSHSYNPRPQSPKSSSNGLARKPMSRGVMPYDHLGNKDSDPRGFARDRLRDQEKEAADDEGDSSGTSASPEQLARKEKDPENDNLYHPEREISGRHRKPNAVQRGFGKMLMRMATNRGKFAIAGGLIGMAMGAGGFGILNLALGPMQFIHLANMLDDMHLRMPNRQQATRADKLLRYIKNHGDANKQTPLQQLNRTRMGLLGSVFADRFHSQLEKAGFTADVKIENGRPRFKGWNIDIEKAMPDLHKSGMNQEDLMRNVAGRLGVPSVNAGADGKFYLPYTLNAFGYSNGAKIVGTMGKIAGISPFMRGLNNRRVAEPLGAGWHPWEKAKNKFKGVLSDEDKDRYKERITKHVKGFGFSASRYFKRYFKNGGNGDIAGWVDEGHRNDDFKDPNRKQSYIDRMNQKLADVGPTVGNTLKGLVVATSSLTAICGIYNVIRSIDDIKGALIYVQMRNMFVHDMAGGNQFMDNNNPDSDTPEVDIGAQAMMASLYFNKQNGTSVFDAASMQAEHGKPYNPANDIPEWQKPGVLGGADNEAHLAFVQSGWMTLNLGSLCEAIKDPVTAAAINLAALGAYLTGVGTVGNMARAVAQLTIKVLIMALLKNLLVTALQDSDAVKRLAEYIGTIISGAIVNPMASGAERGTFLNYGARMMGTAAGIGNAGLPMTASTQLAVEQAEQKFDDFHEKPLYARLFDPYDYRSALGRLIDEQAPTPDAQFALMSRQFFSLGQNIASMPMRIFGGLTKAAPQEPYQYGFNKAAWKPGDLDSEEFDNPYYNAERAHRIMLNTTKVGPENMGKNGGMTVAETYKQRAEYCFGKILDIPANPDTPLNVKDKPEGQPNELVIKYYPMSVQIGGTAADGREVAAMVVKDGSLTWDDLGDALGLPRGGPGGPQEFEDWPPYIQADFYMKGSDGVGDGNCYDESLDWKALRFFMFDTATMNAVACSAAKESDSKSKNKEIQAMGKEGEQACKDTGYKGGGASSGCKQGSTPAPTTAPAPAPGAPPAPGGPRPPAPGTPTPAPAAPTAGATVGGSVQVGPTEIFVGDYETGDFSQWDNVQIAGYNGGGGGVPAGSYSAAIVDDAVQGTKAARFEVRPGDVQAGGERAEVSQGGVANVNEGDERWYEMGIKLDDNFQTPEGNYFIVMQWHSDEGSPPLAVEVNKELELEVRNNRDNQQVHPMGKLTPGQWHCIVLHTKFSNSAATGFVHGYLDGNETLKQTSFRNMAAPGDDNYVKFGIYRGRQAGTHVVFNDGIRITGP